MVTMWIGTSAKRSSLSMGLPSAKYKKNYRNRKTTKKTNVKRKMQLTNSIKEFILGEKNYLVYGMERNISKSHIPNYHNYM